MKKLKFNVGHRTPLTELLNIFPVLPGSPLVKDKMFKETPIIAWLSPSYSLIWDILSKHEAAQNAEPPKIADEEKPSTPDWIKSMSSIFRKAERVIAERKSAQSMESNFRVNLN